MKTSAARFLRFWVDYWLLDVLHGISDSLQSVLRCRLLGILDAVEAKQQAEQTLT